MPLPSCPDTETRPCLRAPRQTEIGTSLPLHTVCAWMGNSKTIAALSVTGNATPDAATTRANLHRVAFLSATRCGERSCATCRGYSRLGAS